MNTIEQKSYETELYRRVPITAIWQTETKEYTSFVAVRK